MVEKLRGYKISLEKLRGQKKYLLVAIIVVAVIVIVIASYIVWVRPAQEEAKTTKFPPRLEELTQKADAKIKQLPYDTGAGISIFYNDYVNIVYNPQYQDNIKSKPTKAFVVINKKPSEETKVRGIVNDFFQGLGVKDLSTLKIVWWNHPEFTAK